MKIKPTYPKSYLIRYKRERDVQTTEVVDATDTEVHVLISKTFKGRFTNPRKSTRPTTQLQVVELDNITKRSRVSCFSYTKEGKTFEYPFAYVGNISPREARIELEKAIKTSK